MSKIIPLLTALIPGLLPISAPAGEAGIQSSPFGKLKSGEAVTLYTLTNGAGMEARIMNYGGIVVSLKTPDASGKLDDVVLGFDTLAEYEAGHPFFGAIVGRYANRIAQGRFEIDDLPWQVTAPPGGHCLHGGKEGFDKKVWTVSQAEVREGAAMLELQYRSPHGEEGFPGNLDCTVTYRLTPQNELKIDYQAVTDEPTVVNLTNHSYFNLAGAGNGTIAGHLLTLHAAKYLDTDNEMIPTGIIAGVKGTPMDFQEAREIGARIDEPSFLPTSYGRGYDHCFVIDGKPGTLRPAATVSDPGSGRVMECLTTEPGVQFYTMNGGGAPIKGKEGKLYPRRGAFCLETQHYPDSPNHRGFPTTELRPGRTLRSTTVYRFSVAP